MQARDVKPGMLFKNFDGYVTEALDNEFGYLTYPHCEGGYGSAMPEDTMLISFDNAQGNECYLIVPPDFEVDVRDYDNDS